jgi:hypothetical protein
MFDTPLCSTTRCFVVGMGAGLLDPPASVPVIRASGAARCRTLPDTAVALT